MFQDYIWAIKNLCRYLFKKMIHTLFNCIFHFFFQSAYFYTDVSSEIVWLYRLHNLLKFYIWLYKCIFLVVNREDTKKSELYHITITIWIYIYIPMYNKRTFLLYTYIWTNKAWYINFLGLCRICYYMKMEHKLYYIIDNGKNNIITYPLLGYHISICMGM